MAQQIVEPVIQTVTFWGTVISTVLASTLAFAAVVWGKNRDRDDKQVEEDKKTELGEMEIDARERQNLIDNMRAFNQALQDRIQELDGLLAEANRNNRDLWTRLVELERRFNTLEVENARLKFMTGNTSLFVSNTFTITDKGT